MFKDLPSDHWLVTKGYVQICLEVGLIEGYPGGCFYPPGATDSEKLIYDRMIALHAKQILSQRARLKWSALRLRETVAPAVGYITTNGGVGAGVTVHSDGIVLTCHHVVAGGRASIRWPDWAESPQFSGPDLQIFYEAPEVDLAVGRVFWPAQRGRFPCVKLADDREDPSESVTILGSPVGFPNWESQGIIARPEVVAEIYKAQQEVVCVSGLINPGNSGGALIRQADATLLGIVNAKLVHTAIEGMGFAVPIDVVRRVLAEAGVVL